MAFCCHTIILESTCLFEHYIIWYVMFTLWYYYSRVSVWCQDVRSYTLQTTEQPFYGHDSEQLNSHHTQFAMYNRLATIVTQ